MMKNCNFEFDWEWFVYLSYKKNPFNHCKMYGCNETVKELSEKLYKEKNVDLVIPITHQRMAQDRILAEESNNLPLILGGHDHVKMIEKVNGTQIVKVGENMKMVAIIDVRFIDDDCIDIQVEEVDVNDYKPDEEVEKLQKECTAVLDTLQTTKLYKLEKRVNMDTVRLEPNFMGTLVATAWTDVLDVDMSFIHGTGVRGAGFMEPGYLSLHTVQSVLPFDNHVDRVEIKGSVLNETLARSRDLTTGQKVSYFHCDKYQQHDENNHIISYKGGKFDPEKMYTVAFSDYILNGGDGNKPLLDFMEENSTERNEGGQDLAIVITYFADLFWMNMVKNHRNVLASDSLTMDKLKECLAQTFEEDYVSEAMARVFFNAAGLDDHELHSHERTRITKLVQMNTVSDVFKVLDHDLEVVNQTNDLIDKMLEKENSETPAFSPHEEISRNFSRQMTWFEASESNERKEMNYAVLKDKEHLAE